MVPSTKKLTASHISLKEKDWNFHEKFLTIRKQGTKVWLGMGWLTWKVHFFWLWYNEMDFLHVNTEISDDISYGWINNARDMMKLSSAKLDNERNCGLHEKKTNFISFKKCKP